VAPTRADAEALDAADELAPFRERFSFGDADRAGRIYLDGNSLGRLPLATREALRGHVDAWGERLVTGWPDWIDAPRQVGDVLAGVIGARPGEVVACDSVTVNLFKLAAATEGPIAARPDDFPTDRYVLAGLNRPILQLTSDGIPEGAGLVALSHVDYRTAEIADLPAVTKAAHDQGALVLWDLSHSAGVLPIGLAEAGADLAVGCTYKHLNAGPGAPAFLYVREDLIAQLRPAIQGWFGQRDQFAMERPYDPAPGIERFLAGTPPIGGLVAVGTGAELVAEAGVERIAAKARALTALLIALHDAWLAPLGFAVATPRDPVRRGAHVALRHPEAWRITRALVEHADVVPDFRAPDLVRCGVSPLFTRFTDVHDAMDRLRALVAEGVHERMDPAVARVT
jgi:kynureninase